MLIPGAWHGGWAWHPVAQRLRAAGHRAVALTLPGLNDGDNPEGLRLQDAVDYVVAQVKPIGVSDVIMVATAGAASRRPGPPLA
ncbi:alpha/beta fold hydrolase [Amycolatopsis sp. NPDC049253]|uniref:alpha/beta fold hydrolase n=1 Tax=Amycolatopsis sp. NPDC049253 TaxID=3155274 RepID=UPI0034475E24